MGHRKLLLSRYLATALATALAALSFAALPQRALAQACECSCAQPSVGYLGPDGACRCPCQVLPSPGLNQQTLSGPPKPPKAGGGDNIRWTFDDFDDEDWPFWGI